MPSKYSVLLPLKRDGTPKRWLREQEATSEITRWLPDMQAQESQGTTYNDAQKRAYYNPS
jgi:hypothetical protein